MNKKILMSLSVIAIVAAIAIGGTIAYFSDTETSTGNTFTAGTIDIALSGKDDNELIPFKLEDMKPSETGITVMNITNKGTNPVNVFKKITNVVCTENGTNDAEDEYYLAVPGSDNWKISGVIQYDMKVEVYKTGETEPFWWQWIFHYPDAAPSISEIQNQEISLGMIPVDGKMVVTQSYHMRPETGNWAQSDKMTFNIEVKGEQLRGYVHLENKDQMGPTGETGEWYIKHDNIYGDLTYNMKGPEFVYDFTGKAPKGDTKYCLIYYADPWAGNHPGALIGCGMTDGGGNITLGGSVNLGIDLPALADANYPDGAKIWLVTASDYNSDTQATGPMTGWNPVNYLFETALITYDDTNTP